MRASLSTQHAQKHVPSDEAPWSLSIPTLKRHLDVHETGLTSTEAVRRLREHGQNQLAQHRSFSSARLFLRQFKSPLILILVTACSVTLFLREWTEAAATAAAILLNTGLGFWQEWKAERVLQDLASYLRTRARVRRDGRDYEIGAEALVPGDILLLTSGDRIPADACLVQSNGLETDEAILTGESLPVEKDASPVAAETLLPDRRNMVWSGTLAVGGFAEAIVTATGSHTELGKIAHASTLRDEETPLQGAIRRLSLRLSLVILVLTTCLFFGGWLAGNPLNEMFLIAVAIAVSSIPEGLPIAMTVILAVGVERLAKKKGVVRRLLAAETLGRTTLILTDKTGTLTQAKLELIELLPATPGKDAETRLLQLALATNEALVENPDEPVNRWRILGRPLDIAIRRTGGLHGLVPPSAETVLERDPFDSTKKFASATLKDPNGATVIRVGAPEILLQKIHLTDDERNALLATIAARANNGERLLAVTRGENGTMRFEGLLAFHDPLRPGIANAIRDIREAGVRTIMVTGDHPGTAAAIAHAINLDSEQKRVITGAELAAFSDAELEPLLDTVCAFARVTPEQKARLVRLYKDAGHIVAVTGDGVNDAPALRQADIGVAIGSGSDVAKDAADLVLLDDRFQTLVAAIFEGRRILSNIKRVVAYTLTPAFDELVLVGGSLLLGLPSPLLALQILYVNLFADSFPAIAYAFEQPQIVKTPPTGNAAEAIDPQLAILCLLVGSASSLLLLGSYTYLLGNGTDPVLARTFLFLSFATYALLFSFSLRHLHRSIFQDNPFKNRALNLGAAVGISLALFAVYFPPLAEKMGHVALPPAWLASAFGIGLLCLVFVELIKWFYRRHPAVS